MQGDHSSIPEIPLEQELQKEKIKMTLQNCVVENNIQDLHTAAKYLLDLLYLEKQKTAYFAQEAAANLQNSMMKS